ncbi:MAG: hypothetical protein P4L81_03625 [Candidatus Pacebacteria bacterium]|nr:hypothetical protein [Candidatus Paceibacterota bacterium]
MWTPDATFNFEHRFVLLTEGPADRKLLETLISKRRLPRFDCPFPVFPEEQATAKAKQLHGFDNITAMLEMLNVYFRASDVLRSQILGVLVVVDARDCADKTFLDVKRKIQRAGSFGVPQSEGTIGPSNGDHPRVAVITLPGGGRPGSLETMYVEALSPRFRSAAYCVEKFVKCGNIGVSTWNAEKQAKARLQCLVAATNEDDPSKGAGYILSLKRKGDKAPLIKMTQKCFEPTFIAMKTFCAELNG